MSCLEVKLLSYTPNPEIVCARAMRGCHTLEPAFEIDLDIEKARRLIRKAIALGHESVLEHASFTFSVKGISRVCSHQLVRHRIASYSQQSMRYVSLEKLESLIIPPVPEEFKGIYEEIYSKCLEVYKLLRERGLSPQRARYVLPMGTPTNIVFTMNARELRHFLRLRLSKHADWEIRNLAREILKIVLQIAPSIFEDFRGELFGS